jgi:hypothetical protein
LRFLIEETIVVMNGNLISIQPRFADVLTGPPSPADTNKKRSSPA